LGAGNITAVSITGIFFLSVLLIFLTPEVYAHFDMSQSAVPASHS